MTEIEILELKAKKVTEKIKLTCKELVDEQNKILDKYKHLKEGK